MRCIGQIMKMNLDNRKGSKCSSEVQLASSNKIKTALVKSDIICKLS